MTITVKLQNGMNELLKMSQGIGKMYIVLFKHNMTSIIGWIIRIVTGSSYTHAGIMLKDGSVIDASERRGNIGWAGNIADMGNRKILVFKISDSLSKSELDSITHYIGKKYDWKGVFGWLWKKGEKDKFYCFEFCWQIMKNIHITNQDKERVSGNDIIEFLSGTSYKGKASGYK